MVFFAWDYYVFGVLRGKPCADGRDTFTILNLFEKVIVFWFYAAECKDGQGACGAELCKSFNSECVALIGMRKGIEDWR